MFRKHLSKEIPITLDKYELTFDRARIDIAAAGKMLRQTFWAANLSDRLLEIALRNSLAIATIEKRSGNLVGIARIITDFATFAYLTDVFVRRDHRGCGLARSMSEALLEHPKLSQVKHYALLASHKRVGLMYADMGFSKSLHQAAWMELFRSSG